MRVIQVKIKGKRRPPLSHEHAKLDFILHHLSHPKSNSTKRTVVCRLISPWVYYFDFFDTRGKSASEYISPQQILFLAKDSVQNISHLINTKSCKSNALVHGIITDIAPANWKVNFGYQKKFQKIKPK